MSFWIINSNLTWINDFEAHEMRYMYFKYDNIQFPSLIQQKVSYIQINYDEISIQFRDQRKERDFYLVI